MIPIPPRVLARFEAFLREKSVPDQLHGYYKKWLRYYLDFCAKYNHPVATKDSVPNFLKKLQEKNQTAEQRRQAAHSVSLYFQLLHDEKVPGVTVDCSSPHPQERESPKPGRAQRILTPPSEMGTTVAETTNGVANIKTQLICKELEKGMAEWKKVPEDLSGEIKIRRYSPTTLTSYVLWARKF